VTVNLGVHGTVDRDMALPALLAAFHRRHPGIRVHTITLPPDPRRFIKEFSASGLVDAYLINRQYFQEIAESGMLGTLEPLAPAAGTYRFLEETFTQQDSLYARPILFSPIVLCYNRQHFREADIPEPDAGWRWRDAQFAARKLSERSGRYGLAFHERSANRWPVFLLQSGMRFELGPDGRCDISGTALLESIRIYSDVIHDTEAFPRLLSETSDDIGQLFASGKASMILASYMSLNELLRSDLDYDLSPVPYFREPKTLTIAMGMCISNHTPVKEAALRVADFLSSEEGQRIIRQRTLSIPALKRVAEAEAEDGLNRPPRYDLFRDILPYMKFHHDLNLTGTGFRHLWQLLKQYWSRLIDDETLCRRIAESVSGHILHKDRA
jgi:multiple sugar transport system substrate-binding protein